MHECVKKTSEVELKWNKIQIFSYPLASPLEKDAGLFETHAEKLCQDPFGRISMS